MTNRLMDAERREVLSILAGGAADFNREGADHRRTRALRGSLPGFDPALYSKVAELGWAGTLIADRHGGSGLGFAEMGAVVEALGRGLLGGPLIAACVLPSRVLALSTNESLQSELLPRLADGRLLIGLAWQEGDGGLDANGVSTTAGGYGRDVTLTGLKRFVAHAAGAGGFLVSATTVNGPALFWLESDAAGLTLTHETRADGTPSGILDLRDAPAVPVISDPAHFEVVMSRALDEARVMVAAEMMGLISEVLDRTLDYLKTRVQFDKPIGSFQSLQHEAVNLFILKELSVSVLAEATAVLDDPATSPKQRAMVASRAKARLSESALVVTRKAIQLHGAIGFTDECDIGLYVMRALSLSAWLGNAAMHRRRFAELSRQA